MFRFFVAKGFQARDGALRASGTNLTFADGRTLFFAVFTDLSAAES
jgi:hypothetical protein